MNSNFKTSSKQNVFPIGFGTGFSSAEYKKPSKIIEMLSSAIDLGVNFIDTGENYGEGEAEKLIGKILKKKRDQIFLSSKFSPENSSYKDIIKSAESSLKRLETDFIDLYQFHWPNPKISLEESAKALLKLKKDGKIRFIGAGNFSIKELSRLQKFLGSTKLSSLQTEFNIKEHFIFDSGILKYCSKNNLNIISYSPLDQGRTDSFNNLQKKIISRLTKKYNKTLTQIILNWIINSGPIIPIPKTLNLKHLEENIASVNFQLLKEDLSLINKEFKSKTQFVDPNLISVSLKGERGVGGYQTKDEALENRLNLIPGPKQLSENLKKDTLFKPIRLIRLKGVKNKKYSLINGRVRYWAWIIAFGNKKPIPSYIR